MGHQNDEMKQRKNRFSFCFTIKILRIDVRYNIESVTRKKKVIPINCIPFSKSLSALKIKMKLF